MDRAHTSTASLQLQVLVKAKRKFLLEASSDLVAAGFVRLNKELSEDSGAASLKTFRALAAVPFDRVFVRIETTKLGRLTVLNVAAFIDGSHLDCADLVNVAVARYKQLQAVAQGESHLREAALFMSIYAIRQDLPSWKQRTAVAYQIGKSFRRPIAKCLVGPLSLSDMPAVVDVALAKKRIHARAFFEVDALVAAALKKTVGEAEGDVAEFFKEYLDRPFKLVASMASAVGIAIQAPRLLAYRIVSGKLRPREVAAALVGSFVLMETIDRVFGVETELKIFQSQVVNEAIATILMLTVLSLSALLVHLPLKAVGGKATLGETLLITLFLSAAVNPIATLLFDTATRLALPGPEKFGIYALLLTLPSYAALHQTSYLRAIVACFVLLPIGCLIIALPIFLLVAALS